MSMTLVVGGREYSQWTSGSVSASMKDATRTFNFSLAERSGGGNDYWAAPGDPAQVYASGNLVCDGFVNEYDADIDATKHDVTISGRGKSQDCIDCSAVHETGRFENMDPLQIAQELAGKVNVDVSAQQTLKKLEKFQIDTGESIFHAVERLARQQGFAVVGQADGSMKLTNAKDAIGVGAALVEGSHPLKKIKAKLTDVRRFSDYEVRNQLAGFQERYGANAAHEVSLMQDSDVTRYRPKILIAEVTGDSQQAAERAEWQSRRIAGDSVKVDAKVQGHTFNGVLWEPNLKLFVLAPTVKVAHMLMVESCTYKLDSSGTCTELKLVPPAAWGGEKTTGNGASGGEAGEKGEGGNAPANDAYSGSTPQRQGTPGYGSGAYWAAQSGVLNVQ